METPFNMIIVGMTGCGKTHYLLKMLETEYKNHFEHIYLICQTYEYNSTYQEWKYNNDEGFIAIPSKQDDVDSWLKQIAWIAKETNSLIILDDWASSQSVKGRTRELVNLGFSARHYGSTIVITQQLTSIAKPYRENISKLVTFYNPSSKDMKVLLEDYLPKVDKNEKIEIMNTLGNNH